ncbi:hypothetical protein BDY19DRAFT_894320 [Irpex rosettiformis]|uniref:Uncharacterized protein n=1 Tax=Irpex rosettiformis TaxID=378272 RepID=A0ACB8TXM5_9APHY|nr:hypothetical protein BDY19DRAFT_894320 [Irpex rosettiformis]
MSTGVCAACGEASTFEEELGSAICLSCGTLSNPSQSILDSHLEHVDSSGRDYFSRGVPVAGGSTLKGRYGRALAGQDKEARERRNMIAMHEFITAIAVRLSHPGSAGRAQAIFDQAMFKGKSRWGKKAKRTAGASLAIALREARKSVSLRDIAFLVDEPLVTVSRSFTTVCTLLQLRLCLFEPAQHLPTLESHLVSLLRTSPNQKESMLPTTLITTLTPLILRLPAIRNIVTSLASLVARVDDLANLPSAPSACALFILGLEGELSASLPNAGALAQALGTRLSVSKAVVMQRYKVIYDLVEEYIKEVPWLEAHEHKPGAGRSKTAKRVVVAKGLKDVVQFQDDIWRRRFLGKVNPVLVLETDPDEEDETSTEGSVYSLGGVSVTRSVSSAGSGASDCHHHPKGLPRSGKRRKTKHDRNVEEISRYLLQPHAYGSTTSVTAPSHPISTSGQDLFQHFLTADDSALEHAFMHPPTRLQLLANSRGGEQGVDDEELFEEDELEGLLRTEEEVRVVGMTVDWGLDESAPMGGGGENDGRPKKRKKISAAGGDKKTGGAKRINMDVLARLLDPNVIAGEYDLDIESGAVVGEDDFDPIDLGYDSDSDCHAAADQVDEGTTNRDTLTPPRTLASANCPGVRSGGGEEEIIEEWRPMSPGGGFDDGDRYDF